jgi:RNA polymerase sigma-70 factor (ECF subfamily)
MGGSEDTEIPFSEVIRLVQSEAPEGMTVLYSFLSRGVRPYLARQVAPQDIQDKIHDVFLEVVRAIRRDQLRDPERLIAFSRTVARRKVAVHIDMAARRRRDEIDFESVFSLLSAPHTPEGELISRQHREMVDKTLIRLSSRERDVLMRFYFEEQDQAQICAEMGLTETQFRLLKWRSKARFAELSRRLLLGPHGVAPSAARAKATPKAISA